MLFFGHIGLTTGIVKVCQNLITSGKFDRDGLSSETQSGELHNQVNSRFNKFQNQMKLIDYRFLLLGSLLPDIIDKPLWLFTGSIFQWDGRGYSHTFLFSFVLLIAGLILALRGNKTQLLTVAAGSFFHLILDAMWQNPTALWWPFLGPILRGPTEGWFSGMWHSLLSNPYDYISETLGFIIILYFAVRLILSRRMKYFLKTGYLDFGK